MYIELSLGLHGTVFQAEVIPIAYSEEEVLRQNLSGKRIIIYSDSQAALKAISFQTVVFKLVQTLGTVSLNNKLTLVWVPGHTGVQGIERADPLGQGVRVCFSLVLNLVTFPSVLLRVFLGLGYDRRRK